MWKGCQLIQERKWRLETNDIVVICLQETHMGANVASRFQSVSQVPVSNEFIMHKRPGKGIRGADSGPATNVLHTYYM